MERGDVFGDVITPGAGVSGRFRRQIVVSMTLDRKHLGGALVPRVVQNAGYNLFNFTRASPVVNCQSALV
jgi:hypothetical protein